MEKRKIINGESRDYTVDIVSNCGFMSEILDLEEPVFIIDANVHRLYSDRLFQDIPSDRTVLFNAIEMNKTLQGLDGLLKAVLGLSARNKRKTNFVSFGGGITQEVTGFIASTLYRGIEHWVNVPTTLLAQSDSCIGGKTSLNVPPYKNILGTFFPPHQTYLNPRFVATNSDYHFHSGLGEIIKAALLVAKGDKSLEELKKKLEALKKKDHERLAGLIDDALETKIDYITGDQTDKGKRNFLNYGHTFGHAMETVSEYTIPHGTNVLIGIVYANILSRRRGLMSQRTVDKIDELVLDYIPVEFQESYFDRDRLLDRVRMDKKIIGDKLMFILQKDDYGLEKVSGISVEEFDYALGELRERLL